MPASMTSGGSRASAAAIARLAPANAMRSRKVTGMTTGSPMPTPPRQTDAADTRWALDDVDRRLIDALREDGRMPLAALGTRVGLSGDATRERLRHLTERGIVQVTCSVDPRLLGYDTMALVALTVTGPAERIAEELVEV